MSEESMIAAVSNALTALGVDDKLEAVGQFYPRGHTGGMFVGGLAGSAVGDVVGGGVGDAIGLGAGSLAGSHANDAASGLPSLMLVGVSPTTVYGFAAKSRSKPTDLAFKLPRDHLQVDVHGRVNVRILELTHTETGSKIQLEGNRIPVTHSKDVIDALQE